MAERLTPSTDPSSEERSCCGSECCSDETSAAAPAEELIEAVRDRYARAANAVMAGPDATRADNRGWDDEEGTFGTTLYGDEELADLPAAAGLASLGCGSPTAVAELREGDVVLDLGSGGGIDVLLSARRVGPTGRAYGLDMTDEMLALARRNAQEAGATNVEFLRGRMEDIPLPGDTVDVVISNCVVNLSPDKPAVFREVHRVLVPGGRIGISDVVAEDHLSEADRLERGSWVGCIAGALGRSEYERLLAAAGFEDVQVQYTHEVADGLHGAIVKARKPAGVAGG